MEMKKTTKAEDDEPKRKIRRKITSLDDEELWAGFETEETDRILSGEIKPKTLITSYHDPHHAFPNDRERGHLIAQEMLSVFPNSTYIRRGVRSSLRGIIRVAKKRGCTSLIQAHTSSCYGLDKLFIISLLNGAFADFRVLNLIPRDDVPNHANPTSRRLYPHVHMHGFKTAASAGTARMIESLFPKVPLSPGRSIAWFENQKDLIFFRSSSVRTQTQVGAVAGESSSSVRRTQKQECGPRFALKLMGVYKVSFDTGDLTFICQPEAKP